jgi:uncharacterized protein (TIGR03085 family)
VELARDDMEGEGQAYRITARNATPAVTVIVGPAELNMIAMGRDAAAGVLGGPLAGYTARVQQRLRTRIPFADLVRMIKSGPPRLSVMALPGMDERVNAVEYFVHHEDVRRAAADWEPRELSSGESALLWQRLRAARLMLRHAPVGVELARDDMEGDGQAYRITARNATPAVTVIGSPAELTMWAMGRAAAARVRFDGTEAAVTKLTGTNWRLADELEVSGPSRA